MDDTNTATESLLKEIDKFTSWALGVSLILLPIVYYPVWRWEPDTKSVYSMIRTLLLSLIPNLLTNFLLFAGSYFLFRRLQMIRAERENNEFANKIAELIKLSLSEDFERIQRNIGISAQFVSDMRGDEAKGEIYRRAAEIIMAAEKEVLVLWRPSYFEGMSEVNANDIWKSRRRIYYDALMNRCLENKNKNFSYRRILQLPKKQYMSVKNGTISSKWLHDIGAIEHCHEMLKFESRHHGSVALKYAQQRSEQTFLLVDENYILLEIDALNPDNETEDMDSLIIFDDRNDHEFVRYLKSFFFMVDAHSSPVRRITD